MSAQVSAEPVYRASPIKRLRRTKAEMESIRKAIESVIRTESPCTVRQVYYQLVSQGAIEKTEAQYDTVGRLLVEMRREGRVHYHHIADNTRWMRKPDTYSGLSSALRQTQHFYRRALWDDQDVYVEIWIEKDALAGVLYEVTETFDVPLMVSRGFASLTFLHGAAEAIQHERKPAFLYYFGDHDPSGVIIPKKIEATLRDLAPDAEIYFERVAVLPHQIAEWNLPTRPTKKTDTRSKSFVGESVEVDAIAPTTLRAIARRCITRHIDQDRLEATLRAERAEKDTLRQMIERGLR